MLCSQSFAITMHAVVRAAMDSCASCALYKGAVYSTDIVNVYCRFLADGSKCAEEGSVWATSNAGCNSYPYVHPSFCMWSYIKDKLPKVGLLG